jgi:phosphatidate cytidylyltransferase
MLRVLTAVILFFAVWAMLKLAPLAVFLGLVGFAVAAACWECYGLMAAFGHRPLAVLGTVASVCFVTPWMKPGSSPGPALPLSLAMMLASSMLMWRRRDVREMFADAGATMTPMIFVGLPLSFFGALRMMPGEDGLDLPLLLLLCVSASDIAALYAGTLLGRHRLAPAISPKKTWEGAAAGTAASILAALVFQPIIMQRLHAGHAATIGLLLGLVGILGDLTESVFKRAAGAKDSSRLLPGHGGVLDRVDSLLFAAPALYYYYQCFLRGSS